MCLFPVPKYLLRERETQTDNILYVLWKERETSVSFVSEGPWLGGWEEGGEARKWGTVILRAEGVGWLRPRGVWLQHLEPNKNGEG